jgi:hypothetical protein
VLLGAGLRLYDLGAESYWYDEMITVRIAADGLPAVLDSFFFRARPPLHLLLASLWMRTAGTTEFSVRYLSAFAGTASIAAIYVVGWRLFSRRVGLVGAFLMALSEFQIWYAQEGRYYALLVLLTLVSFYLLTRASGRSRPSAWTFLTVVNILLIFTHTFAVFTILAQGLYLAVTRWRRGRNTLLGWAISQVVVLFLASPSFYVIARDSLGGGFGPMSWIGEPNLRVLGETLLIYVGSNYPSLGTVVAALGFLATVALLAWLVGAEERSRPRHPLVRCLAYVADHKSHLLYLALWLACLWMLPWLISRLVQPIYAVRYTIGASPALYLLLAVGIAAADTFLPTAAILGAFVILVVPGLVDYYDADIKENWRGAAEYVDERVRPGDAVVAPPAVFGRDAFDWYYEGPIRECDMDPQKRDGESVVAIARMCAGGGGRLWLVLRQLPLQGRRLHQADWRKSDLQLLDHIEFEGVSVYLFVSAGDRGDTGCGSTQVSDYCCCRSSCRFFPGWEGYGGRAWGVQAAARL